MSNEQATPQAKGPAQVQGQPSTTDPVRIPASEINPEDIGALSICYVNGRPAIVVNGGDFIPADLPVVDQTGTVVGRLYTGRLPDDARGEDAIKLFDGYGRIADRSQFSVVRLP
ncbi:hypothetical protein [Streptomyces sp. NPDC056323]|uniref:hypothetical protein n=1 Tax=Streptomyces sp. NPDC056323 TaxID=3345784 RepID=UPI0035DB1D5F